MDGRDPIYTLIGHLLVLSLLAIGGVNVILPDLHRVVVLQESWLTDEEFTNFYALAQAAPGPNMLFVTLIGWSLGGVAGGILATLALCGPPLVLAYGMARLWLAWGEQWWFKLLQRGLAPVTIGLVCASAWLLTDAAASGWQSYVITAVAAVIIGTTRTHPIFILAAAGGLGIAGFA